MASVPDFLKVFLFVKDENDRNQCFETTLLRKVLFSKNSIGTGGWLTGMLQSHSSHVSNLAITYLQIVSLPTLVTDGNHSDDLTTKRVPLLLDVSHNELYDEMSRINDFVPSLLSLNEKQIEEAATTKIVEEVLDQIISRPFAVTVVFCDGFFLALLIFGYRSAVHALLLGKSSGSVLKHVYLANTGTYYFVIREIGKVISLGTITRQVQVYFTFWNLIDLLATILTIVSMVTMRCNYTPSRSLCAVTTGFLWVRVLGYLKGINLQLATFVLAILQVNFCYSILDELNHLRLLIYLSFSVTDWS
jgi:hypothetical protein